MHKQLVISGVGVAFPGGLTTGSLFDKLLGETACSNSSSRFALEKYGNPTLIEFDNVVLKILNQAYPSTSITESSLGYAVRSALLDAKLPLINISASSARGALLIGTTTAGIERTEHYYVNSHVALISSQVDDIISRVISQTGLCGPQLVISNACSSSLMALGLACDFLHANQADFVVVGGVDVLLEYTIGGFSRLGLTAQTTCRPFAENRDGIVLSEGAAICVVEPLDAALKRGATIHGAILGYGESCDAKGVAAPNSIGIERAINSAFSQMKQNYSEQEIGMIFCHGTGTKANDLAEAEAIRSVFANSPPLSAVKSALGHSQAASGIFSVISALESLSRGIIPPVLHTTKVAAEFADLDIVLKTREHMTSSALVTACGFGGTNACVILGAV